MNTSIFQPREYLARAGSAAREGGFEVDTFGEIGGCPLLAFRRRTEMPRPRIYLSAGIHGDEPAPPLALLELIIQGAFDARAEWFLCPLLNPVGLAAGTRENGSGVDLNRDYRDPVSTEAAAHISWLRRQPGFDLVVCLHEDFESLGFYLYEQNPDRRPSLAEVMIAAAAGVMPIDLSPVIDGREARGGIIRPSGEPSERPKWPEAIYLRAHHTRLAYTVETPSQFPLAQRVAALCAVVSAAIEGSPAGR